MPSNNRIVPFEELPRTDLHVGAVYLGGGRGNAGDDPLAKLLPVGNQGGFRHAGSPTKRTVRLSVLYTSGVEEEWPDELDVDTGVFTYFGDNRKPGRNLLDTTRGGNRLLRDAFAVRNAKGGRQAVPPFLLFERAGVGRGVRFRGLLAPGAPVGDESDDLAVVRHKTSGEEFENFRARFTVLGAEVVRRSWLEEILSGAGTTSQDAPKEWREWVEHGSRKVERAVVGSRRSADHRLASDTSAEVYASLSSSADVEVIAPEARVSERFEQQRPGPVAAERRESALQERYLQYLQRQGHDVCRQRIVLPGESSPLYTDLFDVTTRELVEVKSDSGRATIRLALGQILDYARYVRHDSKVVLVPSRPRTDLIVLLLENGVAVLWEESPGCFRRSDPPNTAANEDTVDDSALSGI